jgi:hypothetical protein
MMVVTCSNYSTTVDCPELTFHLDSPLTTKTAEMVMNNFSYEGSTGEFCIHDASSMLGLLISTGMPPEFLDELAEGIKEARGGWGRESALNN